MNLGETVGLYWFITAFLITGSILGYDGTLLLRGLETISGHIGDTLQAWKNAGYSIWLFPWLTVLLPFGVFQQAIGLLVHLISYLWR